MLTIYLQSKFQQWCALLLCLIALAWNISASEHGAVATVHPIATDAAVAVMKSGGNAVDGAVAAALTLGAVNGYNSGIGGGCFFLVRTERGVVLALDGREMAPAAATRDMFIRNGKADPELSQTGALAIGVPGSLAVYEYAVRNFGKKKFSELLLSAAKIAEEGFAIDADYAGRIAATAQDLKRFPETRSLFFSATGKPLRKGDILKQPDLAATYRAIAKDGIDWFYKGPFAREIEAWMKQSHGVIQASDFANYDMMLREPLRTRYHEYEIIGFPPPSSGGVHVAQILNILENFDLQKYPSNSADSIHLITEAMKLAFADRAYWLGDPDFARVPRGLISKAYARELAEKIDLGHALSVTNHGQPDEFSTGFFGKHTTHFSTSDGEGNWVACTATVNTSFGSKVIIPGTGVIMNNQMDDFSAQPGVPNFFGLVGAESNAVAPGKRPLSSMSPTIVQIQGRPILSLGAAGGPTIISQTLLNLINILDYNMNIHQALKTPRFHHQWKPDELKIEPIPKEVIDELERRGHKLITERSMGAAQIVSQQDGKFEAAHDPRLEGKAVAF
ncbi:MAG: gamma-glutamyltransferase [Verrucomicrobiota bacterium]